MKKWYICKYGQHHVNSPYLCTPIGIAVQVDHEDEDQNIPNTYILQDQFSAWLKKHDLCAFGEGYAKALGVSQSTSFPILYSEKNPKGSAV